jgi:hypothetical protein
MALSPAVEKIMASLEPEEHSLIPRKVLKYSFN